MTCLRSLDLRRAHLNMNNPMTDPATPALAVTNHGVGPARIRGVKVEVVIGTAPTDDTK